MHNITLYVRLEEIMFIIVIGPALQSRHSRVTGQPRSHTRRQGRRDRRPAPPVGGAAPPGSPAPAHPHRSPGPSHVGQALVSGALVGVPGHAGDTVAMASQAGATS